MFNFTTFHMELRDLENLSIVVRGRFLGVCSIVQDGTIYQGPAFRDVDGGIWFLVSGASDDSIDSCLRFIRLDREPTPLDVPPLLAFSSRDAIERRRREKLSEEPKESY